jgi:hypothetical protein
LGGFSFLVECIGDLQEVLADEAKVRELRQPGGRLLEGFRTSEAVGRRAGDARFVMWSQKPSATRV